MVYFWWQALWSAVLETFSAIGKDPSDIAFSGLVVVVCYICFFFKNKPKWGKVNADLFKKAFSDEARILAVLCLLIFVYQFAKAPYNVGAMST